MASADLVVNIVTKMAGNGLQDAEKQTSKFKSGLASASRVAGVALLGIGAAAFKAADAAAEDAKSQALLANSMKNAAGATKGQIASTEDWIDAQSRATGVADDELRPALATLVRTTGDVTKSQGLLKKAMDISAATGKPLSSVTAAIAKGYSGNTSALSRLVPGISKAAIESGKFGRVLGEVAKKTKGAAGDAAKTAAGQMQVFKNSLQETQEAAGQALLPALQGLMKLLVPMGHWAQDHGTMFTIIAGGIAAMAIAVIALNAALKIYNMVTAITAIVSKAAWLSALGPIALVVAAVVAVIAIVVILWNKFPPFKNAVMAAWGAIQRGAKAVWNAIKTIGKVAGNVFGWIKSHWKLLAAILGGPFIAATILIISKWDKIKAKIKAVLDWMKSAVRAAVSIIAAVWDRIRDKSHAVWEAIKGKVGSVIGSIKNIVQGLWDTASSVFGRIGDAWANLVGKLHLPGGLQSLLTNPFNALKTAIDQVVSAVQSLIGWLGRIHVPKISLPHIPGLGKAAPPPAVPGGLGAAAAPAVPTARAGGGSGGTGGTVINIYGAVDPESTARQVRRILAGHDRRVGLRVS